MSDTRSLGKHEGGGLVHDSLAGREAGNKIFKAGLAARYNRGKLGGRLAALRLVGQKRGGGDSEVFGRHLCECVRICRRNIDIAVDGGVDIGVQRHEVYEGEQALGVADGVFFRSLARLRRSARRCDTICQGESELRSLDCRFDSHDGGCSIFDFGERAADRVAVDCEHFCGRMGFGNGGECYSQ